MTQNALMTLRFIMAWGWRFLTGVYIPGTNVTPGALFLLSFTIYVVLKFVSRLSNVSPTPYNNGKVK